MGVQGDALRGAGVHEQVAAQRDGVEGVRQPAPVHHRAGVGLGTPSSREVVEQPPTAVWLTPGVFLLCGVTRGEKCPSGVTT